jgi:hypothetical protein
MNNPDQREWRLRTRRRYSMASVLFAKDHIILSRRSLCTTKAARLGYDIVILITLFQSLYLDNYLSQGLTMTTLRRTRQP